MGMKHRWSRLCPSRDDMRKMFMHLHDKDVSAATMMLLSARASLAPDVRLAVNVRNALARMVNSPVDRVLHSGMLQEEREALVELDTVGVEEWACEIAHGLFNVYERWRVMKALAKPMRACRDKKEESLIECILDNVLNREE
jgi:hypothetical protein